MEKLEQKVKDQFFELKGLEAEEISIASIGISTWCHIYTFDRTFFCRLTATGKIKKGTLEEEGAED